MMKRIMTLGGLAVIAAIGLSNSARAANAPISTTTPSSTITATVAEQAAVSLPSTIGFTVNDVTSATTQAVSGFSITNLILQNGKKLHVQLKANTASFTAATGGTVTWAAGDVTWDAGSGWSTGWAGALGTLSTTASDVTASSVANPGSLTAGSVNFTLGAKSTVDRAGSHTLACTWVLVSA